MTLRQPLNLPCAPLYFVSLVLTAFCLSFSPATAASIRVMPLGDSITAGSYGAGKNGIGGYRAVLAQQCLSHGYKVDFVGSLNDPAGAKFDADHEGHRAWRADSLAENVHTWLQAAQPDVILAQAGVNDLIQGADVKTVEDRIETLLTRCAEAAPRARIYIAGILKVRAGNDYHVKQQDVDAVNAALPQRVARLRQRGVNVEYVDLSSRAGINDDDFSADGLHPNDAGYAKMGAAWFAVLRPELDRAH